MRVYATHTLNDLRGKMAALPLAIQKKVLTISVNEAARKGRTLSVLSVRDTSGLAFGYVRSRINTSPAAGGPGGVSAKVMATTDRWSLITQFNPKYARPKTRGVWKRPGARVISARPWNQGRDYHSVFLLTAKGGGRMIPVVRVGKRLKGVYGSAVARELRRSLEGEYAGHKILEETGKYLQKRTTHHMSRAFKSGSI